MEPQEREGGAGASTIYDLLDGFQVSVERFIWSLEDSQGSAIYRLGTSGMHGRRDKGVGDKGVLGGVSVDLEDSGNSAASERSIWMLSDLASRKRLVIFSVELIKCLGSGTVLYSAAVVERRGGSPATQTMRGQLQHKFDRHYRSSLRTTL